MTTEPPKLRVRVHMIVNPPELPFHEFWRVVHGKLVVALERNQPIREFKAETRKRCLDEWAYQAVRMSIFDSNGILGNIDANVDGLPEDQWLTQTYTPDQLVLTIGNMHQRRRKKGVAR